MKKKHSVSPEMALEFLESIRVLSSDNEIEKDLIKLEMPKDLIKSVKLKAKIDNESCEMLMIRSIRKYITEN